ncbi:MAG TPA: hypothetical protein VLT33_43545, partial [Labilithrix sp.]|nr:hypothetical protein [Labilithrix sp.]
HDLVERVVEGDRTPCVTLGLMLLVAPVVLEGGEEYPVALRLARGADGRELVSTVAERLRAEQEAKELEGAGRAAEAAGRAAEAAARQRAEERVAALEKELRART